MAKDICQTSSALYLVMQLGIKSLPGIIFLIAATIRYLSIRHMAKASVTYSMLFKAKVGISGSMAFGTFVYLIGVFCTP